MPERPDPDQLLQQLRSSEPPSGRGRLKIFLGYHSGVGKSFRMFDEGRRRRERGQDVVVGAMQPMTEGEAAKVLQLLEVVPMRESQGQRCMDTEAILRRRPAFCLVDGLAYDNPPGSEYPTRWQEAEALLAAGISVIASVNLQFVRERQARVEKITGRAYEQSIPEAVLRRADEIELVDAPPDFRQGREGDSAEESERKRHQLPALREEALLLAAEVIEQQLEQYLQSHGLETLWGTQERILLCVSPWFDASAMVRHGKRMADRFRGELMAAYVRQSKQPRLNEEQQRQLDANISLAQSNGAPAATLEAEDFVDAILKYARQRGATQLFVGHSRHVQWWGRTTESQLDRLIAAAEGMDVHVFPI